MAVKIAIPTALRSWSGGNAVGAYNWYYDATYLNDEDVRFLPGRDAAELKAGDLLTIVPSIAGGAL